MDPRAAYEAYLNASFDEKHEYYNDLCAWFQRGGCGFAALYQGKRCYVLQLTYTHDAHIVCRNNRTATVRESELELA